MSLFTKVAVKVPRRNAFNLSHENHATANFGALYPVLVQECFPGDKFQIQHEASIKLAPLVFPVMGRIDVYFHTFFVPHRILYKDWEKFITGGETATFPNGGEQTDAQGNPVYVAPYFDFSELYQGDYLKDGTLCDYLGLPSLPYQQGSVVEDVPPISALPFLAYKKIFCDWFRDELLDSSVLFDEPLIGGKYALPTASDFLSLRYRCWHKDYFTSARPDTQLGPEITVPISGNISDNGSGLMFSYPNTLTQNTSPVFRLATQQQAASGEYENELVLGNSNPLAYVSGLSLDDAGMLINSLRRSLRLQEWQERNMRGGNRYIENILHHFGVKSSDARLQRSQYLGGKKIPVVVGEIPQSVSTADDSSYSDSSAQRYLGERGGIANASGSSSYITKFCEEHGFIITLMSILPHASYQQGVPRYFGARWDRFDYLWPEFGNLGEQEVFNWELFVARGQNQGNGGTFGYQSRMADMKFTPSGIHGEFRSSLNKWHNGRIFASRPNLNSAFVHFSDADKAGGQNRIFAVEENSLAAHFYCHLFNHVKVLRMLPKYGIPSI